MSNGFYGAGIVPGAAADPTGKKYDSNGDEIIYGTPYTERSYWNAPGYLRAFISGSSAGHAMFYDDPDMKEARARYEDLAKGYDGKTLGAMRETARQKIAGDRQGYLNQLRSNMSRNGVGGARAAAMMGTHDQRYAQIGAENERKLAADNAQMVSKGTTNFNDFLMKQKLGQLTTGAGMAQLESADGAAHASAEAANSKKGFCFITTAVCESLGLPDDNTILNTFRKFRDEFMGGKEAVAEYYELAPKIVSEIEKLEHAKAEIYMGLLERYLLPAFVMICKKRYDEAEEIYTLMCNDLRNIFLKAA